MYKTSFKFLSKQNLISKLNANPSNSFFLTACRKCSSKSGSSDDSLGKSNNKIKGESKLDEVQNKMKASSDSDESRNLQLEKQQAAKKKLFSLLTEMKAEPTGTKYQLNLSKPVKRMLKKERFKDFYEGEKTPEEKIKEAVVEVAQRVSGDPGKTTQELNEKLAALHLTTDHKQEELSSDQLKAESILGTELSKNLMSSVEEVASTVVESNAKTRLTERILKEKVTNEQTLPKTPIDNLLKSMLVEKQKPTIKTDFGERIDPRERSFEPRPASLPKINIFKAAPLGFFSKDETSEIETSKTVWQRLEEKQLNLMVQFAPANAFEEMIMWTKQGKHWKFPIDNEAEIGKEESVGFHEHVFLEHHLHGFPTKGPIRHFMELVLVGLSKNPYITVERKIENIDWFREYFKDKEDILNEYGALDG